MTRLVLSGYLSCHSPKFCLISDCKAIKPSWMCAVTHIAVLFGVVPQVGLVHHHITFLATGPRFLRSLAE
jgi:hypothetical protein